MRTKEDLEKEAQAAGVTPGELLKKEKADAAHDAAVEAAADPAHPVVKMQHVIITLADGRRGVFMGPELIKAIEFTLGTVPRPVAIDFDPPRAVAVPLPREIAKPEETPNADQKADDKPAA